ncbi:MAG: DUF1559 domain-containing protein [Planctomycetota bacterium]
MSYRKKRQGFTLVELLVVIAIIGILVGLLLPAVQAAREAARRMQCSNNLKQLALACHNYESAHRTFPLAWNHIGNAERPGQWRQRANWGWSGMILPYVEQTNLWNTLQGCGTVYMDDIFYDAQYAPMVEAMRTPLGTFRCPSDVAPELNEGRPFPQRRRDTPVATSNYVCNGGMWTMHWNDATFRGGMFIGTEGIRHGDVTDGTSNTILLGERRWQYNSVDDRVRLARAACVFGVTRNHNRGRGMSDQAFSGRAKINTITSNENRARRGASSMHTGGAMFAFADGSIHFLTDNIDHIFVTDPNHRNYQWCTTRDPNRSVQLRLFNRQDGVTIPGDVIPQ